MSYILDALKKAQQAHSKSEQASPTASGILWSFAACKPSHTGIGLYLLLMINGLLFIILFTGYRPVSFTAPYTPSVQAVAASNQVPAAPLILPVIDEDITLSRPVQPAGDSLLQQHTVSLPIKPPEPAPRKPIPQLLKEPPWLTHLPPDVQAALPDLTLQAHVYAREVSQRFVLLAGKRLVEGAQITPQLRLEQIRPEDVIIRFNQQIFRVSRLPSGR